MLKLIKILLDRNIGKTTKDISFKKLNKIYGFKVSKSLLEKNITLSACIDDERISLKELARRVNKPKYHKELRSKKALNYDNIRRKKINTESNNHEHIFTQKELSILWKEISSILGESQRVLKNRYR